ncbi:MAG: PadR family transcriptional regulator [Acidimicrobiales bacterium]
MRRGAVRRAVLWALTEGPAHGYEVMRRLEDRSGGMWRPSPGSVYPTLQMLEDEGLVRSRADGGTRTYELTDTGQAAASAPSWGAPPEAEVAQLRALHEAVREARGAVRQIAEAGRPHQLEQATEIVREARRALYRLLAEG